MKKTDNTDNYRHSFLFHFLIRFIFMIILPILISWWLYVEVLNHFYRENILATQQSNMEHSLSWLDSSLNTVSNVFTALGSNTEIVYYMEYYTDKSSMLYSLLKNVRSFCGNLYTMTPYLANIKIYSDDPSLLYASPFARLEEIPLDAESLNLLANTRPQEIIWKIDIPENADFPEGNCFPEGSCFPEGNCFPSVYGYQKLYIADYVKCIGYMEVQLSGELLDDHFKLLFEGGGDPHAEFNIYQGDTLIYTHSAKEGKGVQAFSNALIPDKTAPAGQYFPEAGYQLHLLQNQYTNSIRYPQLDLYIIRSGRISDLLTGSMDNLPSILISLIIFLLLALFVWFFLHVASLSRRILMFSSFIRDTDTDNLTPFHPYSSGKQDRDELDALIDAYNAMIREDTSLISKVHKMELLSQDAKYQALQGQIHPHFIYGTLETIRMMALQKRDKETASMILSLSTLIRYSISISSKSVTLKDELETASHYLRIQKVRFDDRMDYTFQIDDELLDLQLPSFLLQPLLENAIVYGVSNTLDHCTLHVNACQKEDVITLSVSNTGLPITPERLSEINSLLSGRIPIESFHSRHNGMALHNISERLNIFFHGQAFIRLALGDNCTSTIITIRKEKKNAENYDY